MEDGLWKMPTLSSRIEEVLKLTSKAPFVSDQTAGEEKSLSLSLSLAHSLFVSIWYHRFSISL